MKKFILPLLLAALLALPSCGTSGESPGPESSSTLESIGVLEEPTPGPTEEPTPEQTAGRLVKMTAYGPYGELIYWHDFTYWPDGKRESVTS